MSNDANKHFRQISKETQKAHID